MVWETIASMSGWMLLPCAQISFIIEFTQYHEVLFSKLSQDGLEGYRDTQNKHDHIPTNPQGSLTSTLKSYDICQEPQDDNNNDIGSIVIERCLLYSHLKIWFHLYNFCFVLFILVSEFGFGRGGFSNEQQSLLSLRGARRNSDGREGFLRFRHLEQLKGQARSRRPQYLSRNHCCMNGIATMLPKTLSRSNQSSSCTAEQPRMRTAF
eukprot:721548-Amphidinium_carterae.1